MVISGLPSLVVILIACLKMYESPRFLLASGRLDESFDILNKYLEMNESTQPLTNDEIVRLR